MYEPIMIQNNNSQTKNILYWGKSESNSHIKVDVYHVAKSLHFLQPILSMDRGGPRGTWVKNM